MRKKHPPKQVLGYRLDEVARNKTVIRINRYRLLTHTYEAAVSAVQRSLVNYAVLFDLTTIRRRTLFDFQRMNVIVFLDENINLFCIRITKIG